MQFHKHLAERRRGERRSLIPEASERLRFAGLDQLYVLRHWLRMTGAGLSLILAAAVIALNVQSFGARINTDAHLFVRSLEQNFPYEFEGDDAEQRLQARFEALAQPLVDTGMAVTLKRGDSVLAEAALPVERPMIEREVALALSDRPGFSLIYSVSFRPLVWMGLVIVGAAAFIAVAVLWAVERFVVERWLIAEQARRALQLRMADIADASSDWFWEMNTSLRFTMCSCAIDGPFHGGRLLGRRLWDMSSIEVLGNLKRLQSDIEERRPFKLRCCAEQGGRTTWYELAGLPFRDDNGRWAGYRGAARDVTVEEVQAQQLQANRDELANKVEEQTRQLREAMLIAEQANQSKSAFLANMSHEIRTPMSSILGLTQLALAGDLQAKQREYFEKIQRSGRHLVEVVNDVLDFSKIEAGKLVIQSAPMSLRECAESALEIVRDQAASKELALHCRIPDSVPDWVLSDSTRLRQILINLLSNAVKFTEVGYVQLVVWQESQSGSSTTLKFVVIDTGFGIDEQTQALLFQDFEQGVPGVDTRFGGSGLGLAICKRIVEMMGGDIGVTSEPGAGSRFWFRLDLPLCPEEMKPERTNVSSGFVSTDSVPAAQEVIAGHAIRVLLVEDNLFNQEVTSQILKDEGMEVSIASNGLQAVEFISAAERGDIDVILMDFSMPVMDGVEASKRISTLEGWDSIPIIALTANVMPEDRERYKKAGMCDFVAKPTDYAVLVQRTRQWAAASVREDLVEAPEPERLETPELPPERTPVFDQSIGLKRCMNREELFQRILASFVRSELDLEARFADALAAKDIITIGRIAHSLKGQTSQIGGMRAHAAAVNLDAACKKVANGEANEADVIAGIAPLIEEMTTLLETVSPLVNESDVTVTEPADAQHLPDADIVGRMLKWAENGDTSIVEYVRANSATMQSMFGEAYDEIVGALENYDFAVAANLLRRFIAK